MYNMNRKSFTTPHLKKGMSVKDDQGPIFEYIHKPVLKVLLASQKLQVTCTHESLIFVILLFRVTSSCLKYEETKIFTIAYKK